MNILLGVSGGIAAYKSAELVRLLRKQGMQVRVVMTASATEFVSPLTFQALSGHTVHCELLNAQTKQAMSHISLARWADALLIAPATANIIAHCSHGLANDLLTTLYLAASCPVIVAPAMNQMMWQKTVTQENVATLRRHGVQFIGPEAGEQACGETGLGRMTEPAAICLALIAMITPTPPYLQDVKVLISAGPTRELLDPVRYITNRSSGKMGYALAAAAVQAGAEVTLVSGPVNLSPPAQVTVIAIETAAEMTRAVLSKASEQQIYIGAAAVADYTPLVTESVKIKKHTAQINLTLEKTQDILAAVASLPCRPFTVGFAAETHDLAVYAKRKLLEKNLDMIAANWVGQEQGGFDTDDNALQVFWQGGEEFLPMTRKSQLAQQLMALIATEFRKKYAQHTA
jgi:phosphopantothenoylcysteine decarboxylase/phosphopantothenate--cysteine ligase